VRCPRDVVAAQSTILVTKPKSIVILSEAKDLNPCVTLAAQA